MDFRFFASEEPPVAQSSEEEELSVSDSGLLISLISTISEMLAISMSLLCFLFS